MAAPDLARTGVCTASSTLGGFPTTNANDGDDLTIHIHNVIAVGEWIAFDLGSAQAVYAWRMLEFAPRTAANYSVQSSPDGLVWTTRASVTGQGADEGVLYLPGAPITARYWRLIVDAPYTSGSEWGQYTVSLFGEDPAAALVGTIRQEQSTSSPVSMATIAVALGTTPLAGSLLVAVTNHVPATWPAGWAEVATMGETGAGARDGLSIATRSVVAGDPAGVQATSVASQLRAIQLFELVGGAYDAVAISQSGAANGTQPLPNITPAAGLRVLVLAFMAWFNGFARTVDPAGYAVLLEGAPNTGPSSIRLASWSRSVNPTSGAPIGGSASAAGAIVETGAQLSYVLPVGHLFPRGYW